MGRTYKFALDRIAEAWGLRNAGTTFRGGSNPHGSWNEFMKMDATRALRLDPTAAGKYHISRMTTDHRLLLNAISYMLMPRKSNHGTVTEEDLILLWAMINEKQINWPYLMAHKLVNYSHGKINLALGLPHFWTKVFPMIPLDVSQEEFVASALEFAITSKHINQMRRDLAKPDAAEEDDQERNVRPLHGRGFFFTSASGSRGDFSGLAKLHGDPSEGQAEEIRMLRDRFLASVGEVPTTTKPTIEVPMTTKPTVEVVTVEVTGVDDVAEVAPAVAGQVEDEQVVTETTEVVQVVLDSAEVVQEKSVEASV
ncbi:hypothetical protein PIB30_049951 [Stylosanthes scabra]|uniref:Uncharacterized protein n=1 Tax=Stylosanthes scabra TaxID=79078 RepID=A0ABU6UKU3_9FABA|nr:hypothetical protein [Stylosanthes scabra]